MYFSILRDGKMLNIQPQITTESRRIQGMQPTHRLALSSEERHKLDQLLAAAMLDQTTARRLLFEHDEALFVTYALSEETQRWLSSLNAPTLNDLARQLVAVW
jgi:hypothetical protein